MRLCLEVGGKVYLLPEIDEQDRDTILNVFSCSTQIKERNGHWSDPLRYEEVHETPIALKFIPENCITYLESPAA